jgi:L-ascorbate metabolism protein UlaG (beta-lactamase superfamily)
MPLTAVLLLVLPAVAPARAQAPASATTTEGVTITFLANEGVMLSSGGKKVLIDALFLKYGPEFPMPADSTHQALQRARPPFDDVAVILATHRHGDHFHPAPVAAHLRANPRATFLTSQQVIDSVRGHAPARDIPASRFMARTTKVGARQRQVVNGITVEMLGIPHGGLRNRLLIEHLAYLVEIGGRRVLHVGDASFSDDVLSPFRLDTARIDVALLPTWIITSEDGKRLIDRWIKPRQVVAIHVSEGDGDAVSRAVQAAYPGAMTFTRSLDSRRW